MNATFTRLLIVVFCSSLLNITAQAKPDNVDGVNVPSGRIPQEIINNKYPRTYFPNTEKLANDEMSITALGTGMPNQSPSNVAASFLVELGNGDKFLFDIGSGSHERIAAQKIPYDYLDKIFISHLHVDHFGDLASFWLGGTTAGSNCAN